MAEDLNLIGYRYNIILTVFFIFYLAYAPISLGIKICEPCILTLRQSGDSQQRYPKERRTTLVP